MTKILIAEDNHFLIKMYKINLEQEIPNVQLDIATDGKIATEKIESDTPDLMLLDLLMPNMDGFAVLEYIKKNKYTFPVIILTNLSQDINQQKCKEFGASDYYVKSDMDLDELVIRINKHLS